jgi:hypothetical protein
MCLAKITKKVETGDKIKSMTGYKVVGVSRNGDLKPYYYAERYTYVVGETVTDLHEDEDDYIIKGKDVKYEPGFHVFKYLKDARLDGKGKSCDYCIIKVKGSDIQVIGEQKIHVSDGYGGMEVRNVSCFVCKTMKIESVIKN